MKIWRMFTDHNNMVVDQVNPDSFKLVDDFTGKLIVNWNTPELIVIKKGENREFPHISAGIPIFSDLIIGKLEKVLKENVQLLDVNVVNYDINLKIINVLNIYDAVDYKRSIPETTLSGRIKGFKELHFKLEKVASHPIFKIHELPLSVFVSDEFRESVLQAKLKGFDFIETWSSEENNVTTQEEYIKYVKKLEEMEINKGSEFTWSDAMVLVDEGKTVASGSWKIHKDEKGNIQISRFGYNSQYYLVDTSDVPSELNELKWHEVERS
ncbi:imm11 family protein [Paenibacillus harenae]|uniref:Immunity MXAN-0049 protein domain-containing protein n=1 Tax=Paenibacillus harenae TaxID=306543 RepID=A0ABT9TTL2_PAEHA|nr:DUF1629 domain-containing protein [Paenibacillus harenae]MDQ0110674.1 hypothetical protein [Paenibacillus harenae]